MLRIQPVPKKTDHLFSPSQLALHLMFPIPRDNPTICLPLCSSTAQQLQIKYFSDLLFFSFSFLQLYLKSCCHHLLLMYGRISTSTVSPVRAHCWHWVSWNIHPRVFFWVSGPGSLSLYTHPHTNPWTFPNIVKSRLENQWLLNDWSLLRDSKKQEGAKHIAVSHPWSSSAQSWHSVVPLLLWTKLTENYFIS